MAEAKTKKEYTLEELYHLFYFTRIYLEEYSANVRSSGDKALPSDLAQLNFYTSLYEKLKKIIQDRLHKINDEL